MAKRFTVSILTYKAFPLVKQCVESVLAHSNLEHTDIILTANGNKQAGEYFESIRAMHPKNVKVVHNEHNEGFIKPNIAALKITYGRYFVMLNDDAQVPPGWLEAMEKPFEEFPTAALSGLRGGCQSLTPDFHGRQGGAFEYLEGSCLMCKTSVVKKHGLFSDYLEFAYGEDSDLSLRMRQLGYTLHQVDLVLRHARAQTSRHIPNIGQIQAKNHAVLKRKWGHYLRVRKFDYPIIVRRWAARGDALLVTAILKQLKEQNPLSPIFVETAFPELFYKNPHIVKAATQIPRAFDMRFINLDMAYEARVDKSIVDAYAEVCGIEPPDNPKTEIDWDKEDDKWVEEFLGEGTWCAIHAGPTTWTGKNWAHEKWVELCVKLREEYGLKVVLVGHGESTPIPCDRDARGAASPNRTAALLYACKIMIGLDSFPIHLSQAVGTPTIGLFGVTMPERILTKGSACVGVTGDKSNPEYGSRHKRPGLTVVKSDGSCMKSITVGAVMEAVDQLSWVTKIKRKEAAV